MAPIHCTTIKIMKPFDPLTGTSQERPLVGPISDESDVLTAQSAVPQILPYERIEMRLSQFVNAHGLIEAADTSEVLLETRKDGTLQQYTILGSKQGVSISVFDNETHGTLEFTLGQLSSPSTRFYLVETL